MYCTKKIVLGRLLMIDCSKHSYISSALPSGIVWVDVPSPSIVSGVANTLQIT